jgi:hypothetical protein
MKFYMPVLPVLLEYYVSDRRIRRCVYGTPAYTRLREIMVRCWNELSKPENWTDEPGTEYDDAATRLIDSWKAYSKRGYTDGASHQKNWDAIRQIVMTKYESIDPPAATDLTDYMEQFNERLN